MGKLPPRCSDLRRIRLGATPVECGCHFSVWAPYAEKIIVHLFDKFDREIDCFAMNERRGGVWFGYRANVKPGDRYAYEALGKNDPQKGFYFKEGRLLVDPYAHILSRPFEFDKNLYLNDQVKFLPKCIIPNSYEDFDWEGVEKPNLDRKSTIIYEANVKGLTMLNPQVKEEHRGKFLGLSEPQVIAHLKRLGITAVQLNPVAARMSEPFLVEKGLSNYWGYNPVVFMAPDPRFAVEPENVLDEFRTMVKALHKNNIAVILDVVFNHTAEAGFGGPVLSFKGLDNRNYYAFATKDDGSYDYENYLNVTGCGNSFNSDNLCGLNVVVDSMRWWLSVMKVDGFRFDLGVTVFRETHGNSKFAFEKYSAFAKACFCLDEFSDAILIAEPWDLGPDGYRLGQFPKGWSEQNDVFRDTVRRFWRGDNGLIGDFATRLLGSRDIFHKGKRSINASVNFVTYHDGMTLEDLVSYDNKHNELNKENNQDGTNSNYSSNCGVEGPTDNKVILAKRAQIKRNLIATTLIAQGLPHLLAGDEFSNSQNGNNNAYCQDNEISYIKWNYSKENENLIKFIGNLTLLRKGSEMLSELILEDDPSNFKNRKYQAHWYMPNGRPMRLENWNDPNQKVIMLEVGTRDINSGEHWLIFVNETNNDIFFTIKDAPDGRMWSALIDTSEEDGIPRRYSDKNNLINVGAAHSIKVLTQVTRTDVLITMSNLK